MRCALWIAIAILVLITASGCLQPAKSTTMTPPPQFIVVPSTTVPLTATADLHKQVDFNITSTKKTVSITITGGPDASDLEAIKIRIDNQDSSDIERTIPYPQIGFPYVFSYMGLADPVTANIIGTFKGGYQQTLIIYYF